MRRRLRVKTAVLALLVAAAMGLPVLSGGALPLQDGPYTPSAAWADEPTDGEADAAANAADSSANANADDPLEDNEPDQVGNENANAEEQKALDPQNLVNAQQLPDSSFIYDTLIADLATADSYLNNQTVQVIGEAVGDNISAEFNHTYCWIDLQALDQSNSQVAVYMTKEQAALIDTFGKYDARGTTLQVRGIFHLACPEHAGLSDLHANNVTVMKKGEVWESTFHTGYAATGFVLIVLGVGLLMLFRYMQERRR